MIETSNSPSEKSGLPPGSLVHVGDVHELETKMSLMNYSTEEIIEESVSSIEDIVKYTDRNTVTWVIIEGLANTDIVKHIGEEFNVHQLVLEDILNTHQRPKFEDHGSYLFIVLKYLKSSTTPFSVDDEQVSILVFNNFVFVFKEKVDDLFDPVIQRIKTSMGRFRSLGSDYLTYAILDTIVDKKFVLIDLLDDEVTDLELELLGSEATEETLKTIQRLKREIIHIRRFVSPLRELISGVLRSESELIHDKTYIYLRDVADHVTRVIEQIESYRDMLSGLLDIYISSVSFKMNEVMKVLTVLTSIFIPMTFLAGIYGMNFEYMPELKWKWAYPALWSVFFIIPVVLVRFFKKKNWL